METLMGSSRVQCNFRILGNIAIQVWEVLRFQKPNQKLLVVVNDHDSYSMSSDCGSWKDLLVNVTKSNGRRQGNHKICLIAPPDIYDKRQIFDSGFHNFITEIKQVSFKHIIC